MRGEVVPRAESGEDEIGMLVPERRAQRPITDEHEAPRLVALRISLPNGRLHIEPTGFLPLDVRATNPDGGIPPIILLGPR